MSIVVGAVIVRDGLVLAARRARPVDLAGYWEFPGGKVEAREDVIAALEREIEEELLTTIDVLDEVVDDGSPWRICDKHVLKLFLAANASDEPVLGADHNEIRWLGPDELTDVDWLSSDRRALPAVRRALERL